MDIACLHLVVAPDTLRDWLSREEPRGRVEINTVLPHFLSLVIVRHVIVQVVSVRVVEVVLELVGEVLANRCLYHDMAHFVLGSRVYQNGFVE